MHFQPAQGWSIAQVLEHIGLTNHFLLILIDKAAEKARKNVNQLNLQVELQNIKFDLAGLEQVGTHGAFAWIRPEHMEPSGQADLATVRRTLHSQLQRCLTHLDQLPGGEGLLYTTTMTVNGLGRLNVYEYLYFLAMHARRHLFQLETILKPHQSNTTSLP
ncbi:hypothetical protein GCM10008938_04970 [Deinococcus roseus]|uniref:DinB-like domain-containing protein n=1 Tax=Deinococcus roseus TaxID=392414 RepID=A0ABQ2CUE2_9DEIO|nr:hypothetical protein GCM10008938_04970 [Deinococcus roseus]